MKLFQAPHWPSLAVILLAVFVMFVIYHVVFHGMKGNK